MTRLKKIKPRRVKLVLTTQQRAALGRRRRQIARELPELNSRNQARKRASDASTLSGELCRAIHASPLTLAQVANGIGVTLLELDQFLTGEHGLQSDTMDRLAKKLGFELKRCG